MLIKNDAMLLKTIGNDLVKVIDDVSKWILNQIEQSLISNVYNYPEGDYERLEQNGGLLGAWKKDATEFIGNYISVNVGFDPSLLAYVPSLHQHGSLSEDRRQNMPQLIEEAPSDGYDFGGSASIRRPFWDVIEKSLSDGSLDAALESAFTRHGFVWQRM